MANKSHNQETGLGNRGPLEALNDIKLILNDKSTGRGTHAHLGPIWCLLETSDIPYSIPQTSFLVGTIFTVSYSKSDLTYMISQKMVHESSSRIPIATDGNSLKNTISVNIDNIIELVTHAT